VVPALPLLACVVIVVLTQGHKRLSSSISILAMLLAWLISTAALLAAWTNPAVFAGTEPYHQVTVDWIPWPSSMTEAQGRVALQAGLLIDGLSLAMLFIVTTVSLLVQIYSQGIGYMNIKHERGYSRYFAFMSLFTTSMLGLVIANTLLQVFFFWELVGLSSYLLIGFWYDQKPDNPRVLSVDAVPPSGDALTTGEAAKKAFVVTRFGDVGFLIGNVLLVVAAGTFNIPEIFSAMESNTGKIAQHLNGTLGDLIGNPALNSIPILNLSILALALLLIFFGAMGKSSQFPLHVWLPDAMKGPTPVSALIHAATMVAAGVYVVARLFPLWEHATAQNHALLGFVAVIGVITAFMAATIGLVMTDIKKVLAYSTISQLGYMMIGMGALAVGAGFFHLFTHAFFKALLFLGAGSVIHATGSQEMRSLGGLRKHMPVTHITFLLACLAMSGFPFFSGFFSKDEILASAQRRGAEDPILTLVYWLALITAGLTAFYMFRLYFRTFWGEYKNGAAREEEYTAQLAPVATVTGATKEIQHADSTAQTGYAEREYIEETHEHEEHDAGQHGPEDPYHPHESPATMAIPLILLAIPTVVAGFLAAPFIQFITRYIAPNEVAPQIDASLFIGAIPSLIAAAIGIVLATLMYGTRTLQPFRIPVIQQFLEKKWYMDYFWIGVVQGIYFPISRFCDWFDGTVVDGFYDGLAHLTQQFGRGLRRVETGRVQNYGLLIFAGVVILTLAAVAALRNPLGW
jgi:NAD(P)H-quinone oxidoreductase subunit 5